ncbi:MAG: hypothetical protein EZS28_041451 [Streblomastix strix]|uniref:Uncharacterized protein n=1 Tax=Streblomastix strix TaxID=222440 RepID=A0A5J4TYK0_9EUKA|nr:MAG: hypothetical protein EZS28_041451 [Streblomastix strix]
MAPISPIISSSVDDSNYVKKTGQQYQQVQGNLRKSGSANSIGTYDYLTLGDIRDNTGSFGQEFILRNGQLTQSIDGKLTQQLDDYQSYENIEDDSYITKGNALDGLVQLDGQTVQIINEVLRKRYDAEEESESEDDDYCTKGYVGGQVNNTAQTFSNRINGCVQKTGFQSQVITGTLKMSDTPESDLASLDYPTAHYVNNQAMALISTKFITYPVSIQSGFNLQKYKFYKIGDAYFLYLDASATTDKSSGSYNLVATMNNFYTPTQEIYQLIRGGANGLIFNCTVDTSGNIYINNPNNILALGTHIVFNAFWTR